MFVYAVILISIYSSFSIGIEIRAIPSTTVRFNMLYVSRIVSINVIFVCVCFFLQLQISA